MQKQDSEVTLLCLPIDVKTYQRGKKRPPANICNEELVNMQKQTPKEYWRYDI